MKIYGNKPPENLDKYLKVQGADKNDGLSEKNGADKTNKEISDRVNLSGKAKEIAELKEALNQLPEIRTDKVESIKKAIEEGTYKVDSYKIAGKIIDEIV